MTTVDLRLGDCLELMRDIPAGSVDAVITSPPYWNQREYSQWETYDLFIADCAKWIEQIARISKTGRHVFWVIPDKLPFPPSVNGTKERMYLPFYSDCERIANKCGFIPEFPIVWDKRGENLTEQPWSKKMWGSYPYPIGIIHTPFTERICIWRRSGSHGLTQKDRAESKITAEQWNKWATDIWSIRIAPKGEHPAPFPEEIPTRLLTLWTMHGDTILDPFMGSGTTGVACVKLNRNFIGMEIDPSYFAIAQKRIADAQAQLTLW